MIVSGKRQRGFTLLEVLIALAILAIALAAAIKSISSHVSNLAYLKERSLAHWVGLNALTELRISGQWPSSGELKGDEIMAGREFNWRIKVTKTEGGDVHRVDLTVTPAADDEQPLSTMVAYIGGSS
ncbi:MAG TPA: type II secretion system protein GspI [Candidatus Tenderia electrophaga]|uniref:Type II secretion system protein I n=1 Tax=Candidatus Tenderia electrophaga TaxID=1748243 RepID=A0A832J6Y8_9GAMM|nr:type II secretion system protein GspI [Candidatus Tenderia electrophaga]